MTREDRLRAIVDLVLGAIPDDADELEALLALAVAVVAWSDGLAIVARIPLTTPKLIELIIQARGIVPRPMGNPS